MTLKIANVALIQEISFRTDNTRTLIDSDMLNMLVVITMYAKNFLHLNKFISARSREKINEPRKSRLNYKMDTENVFTQYYVM